MNAQEIYETEIKPLSPPDRLRIATLILNEIPPESFAAYSEEWSEEDLREFTAGNWRNLDATLEEDSDGSDGFEMATPSAVRD